MTVTVTEIVCEWLVANGYDGLAGDGCGCTVDDLMPCNDCHNECVAGHHVPQCPTPDECGPGCNHHVVPGERGKGQAKTSKTPAGVPGWPSVGDVVEYCPNNPANPCARWLSRLGG